MNKVIDDVALNILRSASLGGMRTYQLARRCRVPTDVMRHRLNKLQATGKVARHDRLSACNDIYWVIVP